MSLHDVLTKVRAAGLDSIPGGGGEILVDRVREAISPLKIKSDQWLEVMEEAHQIGMKTTATMMYRHVETPAERVDHLRRLREQQDRSLARKKRGGDTRFRCWRPPAANAATTGP